MILGNKLTFESHMVEKLAKARRGLGLMKQFVRSLSSESECFQHILTALPGLSFEKIRAGVFDGPQIRLLIRDQEFSSKMNDRERSAWLSFVAVVENFLAQITFVF